MYEPPGGLPDADRACRDRFGRGAVPERGDRQAEVVRYLVASGRRIIVIAVRNPYDLVAFPQLRTYLVTYEYTRPALAAAVRVIFGERQAQGHLPVSLPLLDD